MIFLYNLYITKLAELPDQRLNLAGKAVMRYVLCVLKIAVDHMIEVTSYHI